MSKVDIPVGLNRERRQFVGWTAFSLAAAGLSLTDPAQAHAAAPAAAPRGNLSFGALK
ncbi:hypothetical protein SAMN05428997_102361 [Bosea sp. CRIB-10]|nr:hypothetical protein SAMN05428997_102361 [Bosea sp. CRIB-10]